MMNVSVSRYDIRSFAPFTQDEMPPGDYACTMAQASACAIFLFYGG